MKNESMAGGTAATQGTTQQENLQVRLVSGLFSGEMLTNQEDLESQVKKIQEDRPHLPDPCVLSVSQHLGLELITVYKY